VSTAHSTILVVEDEEDSRESLREFLELEGYRVETAVDGQDALAKLDRLADDLCVMLLDLIMPVMDGWQLLERLRNDGRLARMKVLVTTSAAHRAPAGIPVFQKPLDLKKVVDAVAAVC
jgi:CheY-like chemotaxis protein